MKCMLDNDMLSKSWRRLISGPQPEVAFARGSDSGAVTDVAATGVEL